MVAWKIGLALLPLCVGCQQMRLPTAPDAALAPGVEVAPLRVVDNTRPVDAAATVPVVLTPNQPRVTVPAWQQALLSKVIASLTDEALRVSRETPGAVVMFELEAVRGGSVIVGELRDPRRQSELRVDLHYLLVPGVLSFPDKATFLQALATAVTFKAEVRLRTGEIACCSAKPAIGVTGRFEGEFQ